MRRRSDDKTVPVYNNLPVYSGSKRRKTKEQVEAIKAQAETEAKTKTKSGKSDKK